MKTTAPPSGGSEVPGAVRTAPGTPDRAGGEAGPWARPGEWAALVCGLAASPEHSRPRFPFPSGLSAEPPGSLQAPPAWRALWRHPHTLGPREEVKGIS